MKFCLAPDRSQSIVVNAADLPPLPTLATLPRFELRGETLVQIPLTLPIAQGFNRAGIALPSPIDLWYQWPKIKGLHDPMPHQRHTASFATVNPRAYVLNEIGTGKTYSMLWATDYLRQIGEVRRVLIISTVSTLRDVWFNSIYETFNRSTGVLLTGERARRRKLAAKDFDYYIVNHDGVEVLCDIQTNKKGHIQKCDVHLHEIDAVIIDEMTAYRNTNTMLWKVIKWVIDKVQPKYVWGLSGKPTPQSPTDAFGQLRLITPERAPQFYGQFRGMVQYQVTQYKWQPYPDAHLKIAQMMQPSILYRRDMLNLPPTVTTKRSVEMTTEQKNAYKDMLNEFAVELDSGAKITAVNAAVKASKLLQISNGVIYDRKGQSHVIGAEPKIKATVELIDESPGKVIIFCPVRGAIRYVVEQLEKRHYTVAVVHGDIPPAERSVIFTKFQKAADPRILVADAQCMAHGLTLTEASTIIWFGPEESAEIYDQACGRITRVGQKHVGTIVQLSSSPADRAGFARIDNRAQWQDMLLKVIEEGC